MHKFQSELKSAEVFLHLRASVTVVTYNIKIMYNDIRNDVRKDGEQLAKDSVTLC